MDCPKCHSLNPDSSRFCGNCAAPLNPARAELGALTQTVDAPVEMLPRGTVIAGKYEILEPIGRGGMGIVYKAEDIRLRRSVALKFLPPHLVNDPESRERFIQEAQALSSLDHPHICTIHEIGETDDGWMYINMSHYGGESLKDKIERGPVPVDEAVEIAAQISRGLTAAHGQQIIHRDIKPGNIIITEDGTVKILDFGLAKLAGEARLTRTGQAPGTVAYISPEMLQGKEVDGRADLWSLGVVIHEMLTGKLPFSCDSEHAYIYAIVNKEPDLVGSLPDNTPADLVRIIRNVLAKNPEKRYPSAKAMGEALSALQSGTAIPRPSFFTRLVDRIERFVRERKRAAAIAPLLALAVLTVFLILPERGRSIAFMPLTAVGGNDGDRLFAEGLSESLSRSLGVIINRRPRSWVFPIAEIRKNEVREALEAMEVLGADIVISGTFRRSGDQVTLTLEAVAARGLRNLATLPKADSVANIATWQQDVAIELARAVGIKTTELDRKNMVFGGTTAPAAFRNHVKGLGRLARADSAEQVESAVIAFEEALVDDPSFSAAGVDLAGAHLKKYSLTGDEASALAAESLCREVIQRNDGYADAYLMLGRILRKMKKPDEAVREFERALSQDPYLYEARFQIGRTLDEANRPAEAETAYLAARRMRPDYWATYGELGFFYFYQGDFDKARRMFLKVTKISPGYIEGLNNLGAAYYQLGDIDRAESTFEKSNAVRRNSDACSNLGFLHFFRGRYADAMNMFEAAIELGSEDYRVWGNLADTYYITPDRKPDAEKAYEKAIDLAEKQLDAGERSPHIQSSLAVFLAKSGFPERARAEIEKALKMRPDDSSILLKAVLTYELSESRAEALEALANYCRMNGPMEYVTDDPFLVDLRTDPGYAEIVSARDRGK